MRGIWRNLVKIGPVDPEITCLKGLFKKNNGVYIFHLRKCDKSMHNSHATTTISYMYLFIIQYIHQFSTTRDKLRSRPKKKCT